MMDWQTRFAPELKRVVKLLENQLGVQRMDFDESAVPEELAPLIPLARIFGISDDGVRCEAIEMMPPEFVEYARACVLERSTCITDWVGAGPWNSARSAMLALDESLGYPEPGESPLEPDPEIAAKILQAIKDMKFG